MSGKEFIEIEKFLDKSFMNGLVFSSSTLGDPIDENHEGHPKNWIVGAEKVPLGQDRCMPDIFLIIASDDPDRLIQTFKNIHDDTTANGLILCYEEEGHDLSYYGYEELRGHEHFGFKDRISQPGIRGKLSEQVDNFLTPGLKTTSRMKILLNMVFMENLLSHQANLY